MVLLVGVLEPLESARTPFRAFFAMENVMEKTGYFKVPWQTLL